MKNSGVVLLSFLVALACGSPAPEPTGTATNPTVESRGDTIVFAAPVTDAWELFTFELSDPSPQQLTSLGQDLGFPVWSPAGDRIAFIAMSERTADLMVLDVQTGDTSILLAGYNELADWDRQGERLLVGLEEGLHFLDVATGDLEPIETGSAADAYGRCARDADLIAYESGRDGNPEVYVTHLDTGDTARLTENTVLDEWPSPSPDGTFVAWASGTEEDKNLWVMRSNGSEKRQITSGMLFGDAFPEWSPDGSSILLTVNENDTFVLKLIDLASGGMTHLGEGAAPSWR
jgi:Tol biopolymer transport system component